MSFEPERIPVRIFDDHEEITRHIAGRIAELIRAKAAEGRPAVLGLATGSTPLGVYRELIRLHREESLDFSNVITFNLDEYYPMDPAGHHSYRRYMQENFFDFVNIEPGLIHMPASDAPEEDLEAHCLASQHCA